MTQGFALGDLPFCIYTHHTPSLMRFSDLSPNKQATAAAGLTGLMTGAIIWLLSNVLHLQVDAETATAIGTIVAFIAGVISRLHIKAILPVVLLLVLPSITNAQSAVPSKLLELETIQAPTSPSSGSWTVAKDKTTLYISGSDSARVYFTASQTDRVIIAKVGGASWVRAGFFGWFRVTDALVTAYNSIQRAAPTDWDYLNFNPLELAYGVAVNRDGVGVLSPGVLPPRGWTGAP